MTVSKELACDNTFKGIIAFAVALLVTCGFGADRESTTQPEPLREFFVSGDAATGARNAGTEVVPWEQVEEKIRESLKEIQILQSRLALLDADGTAQATNVIASTTPGRIMFDMKSYYESRCRMQIELKRHIRYLLRQMESHADPATGRSKTPERKQK